MKVSVHWYTFESLQRNDLRLNSGVLRNKMTLSKSNDFENFTRVYPMVRASMIIIFLGSFIGMNLVDRKMDSIKLNDHFANTEKIIFCILFNNWTEFIILSLLTAAAVLTVHDTGDLAKRIVNEISYFSNGLFLIRCQILKGRSLK